MLLLLSPQRILFALGRPSSLCLNKRRFIMATPDNEASALASASGPTPSEGYKDGCIFCRIAHKRAPGSFPKYRTSH